MRKISVLLLLIFICALGCSKDNDLDTSKTPDKTANLKDPGDSANDFLSDSKYKNLVIQIGYVTGFAPTEIAISNFVSLLSQRTHKDEISVVYKELTSPDKDSLSIKEISELETKNRTMYTNGDTLGLYIYFSDASSNADKPEEDLVTLGAVYRNTSMVIYEATIRKLASKSILLSTGEVESATICHEAGHLFGLVDIGSPSVVPHQDPSAESHCNIAGCLMRAELQFGNGMAKMLTAKGGRTPGFGVECIKDLRANGGR
ncbi:hypothetical protein KCTC52924_02143 [Arenibacter antarcticus]|uniref:Membrane metalloprotease n=1 Tax=Arenibacter antarcticus TaxID=2040469 RepID=A0ABW5VGX1_9FLAO|nr:hypothetical protein [Arenibacter sp. H213]MCM4168567.1 hypothetical protein [Arenibacter sp. H213]